MSHDKGPKREHKKPKKDRTKPAKVKVPRGHSTIAAEAHAAVQQAMEGERK